MKKIQIINNVNGREFGGQFQTQELAQAWIDSCITKNSWGKPDRWLSETDGLHTDTREVESEEGNLTEYFFPVEYAITITDLTQDADWLAHERMKAAKLRVDKNIRDIDFGKFIIAFIGDKNEEKQLTHEQKNQLMNDEEIKTIQKMLEAGRIGYSKLLIEAFIPDNIFIDLNDKNEVLDLMGTYLNGRI